MTDVTWGLRQWIEAYDSWMNEGEGEPPDVSELCQEADAIDRAVDDEVAYALAQAENDRGDWVEPVRCRECRHAHERNGRLVCRVRPMSMHVTEADGWCHRGKR